MNLNPALRQLLSSASVLKSTIMRPTYREYMRLLYKYGRYPRFTETTIHFDGTTFTVPDTASFLSTYESLIYREVYSFVPTSERPIIVDFGANIGLSVHFWRKKYPQAIIHAYEADPYIYQYLERNTQSASNAQVAFPSGQPHIYNAAVYDKNTTLHFASDHADGGHVASSGTEVKAVDAADIVVALPHIDMLKMDIEGSERAVVPRVAPYLDRVDNVFIEYHSEANRAQCLPEILTILKTAGFRIYIQNEFCA